MKANMRRRESSLRTLTESMALPAGSACAGGSEATGQP
jgi:hypothetical protein